MTADDKKTPPDPAGDIADAVGAALGTIINELEKLEARRGELLEQLRKASQQTSSLLDKYLPAGVKEMPRRAKQSYQRARQAAEKPCSICGFQTDPPHDGRLKAHRDQDEKNKRPLTDAQLAELNMRRVD